MTLREFCLCAAAYNRKQEDRADEARAAAWQTAAFSGAAFAGKLKPYRSVRRDKSASAVPPIKKDEFEKKLKLAKGGSPPCPCKA